MLEIDRILIIVHACFGGIALVTGGISLLSKKGSTIHKRSGKAFYYTMLTSVLMSLFIAIMPNHKSSFLFSIGLFSLYFIIGGYRSLKYKMRDVVLKLDKILGSLIIVTGITMVVYPIMLKNTVDTVLMVFGIIAIIFGVIDLILLNNVKKLRKNWLKIHLSKMISGYVAAMTAFVVVNGWIPGVWAWFTPGVFGTIYMFFWLVKLNNYRPNKQGIK